MQNLTFELEDDSVHLPAVGLVVLQSDEVMESELSHWLTGDVRLFHTRIPNAQEINATTLHAMKAALPAAVALLPEHADLKVIVYGCTSATTVIGEDAVTAAVQSVFPDASVTNPLSAIKAELDYRGLKRIALLSPYVPDVSLALIANLTDHGFEVCTAGSFHEEKDHRVSRIARHSLLSAIELLGQDTSADAIVASCTNLRMVTLIEEASRLAGRPVISSNSALAWHIRAMLGLDHSRVQH